MEIMEKNQSASNDSCSKKIVALNKHVVSLSEDITSINEKLGEFQEHFKRVPMDKKSTSVENKELPYNEVHKVVNLRKIAYYKNIRSEGIATIYREFLNQEPPFIPMKFREGKIPGESEQQGQRMRKLETTRLTMEVERLEEESSKHQLILENSEKEVNKLADESKDPIERQKIKEVWTAEIHKEEVKSREIWTKQETFFKDLPSETIERDTEIGQGEVSDNNRDLDRNMDNRYHRKFENDKYSDSNAVNRQRRNFGNNRNYGNNRNFENDRNFGNNRNVDINNDNHHRNNYSHQRSGDGNGEEMFGNFIQWMNNNGKPTDNKYGNNHNRNFHQHRYNRNNR
jgi:septum formation inhibitor MinC